MPVGRLTGFVLCLGVVLAALAGGVGAIVIAPRGLLVIVLVVAATIAGGLSLILPAHTLPAVALIVYVLLPQQAIGFARGAAPAAVVLTIWAIRKSGRIKFAQATTGTWLMRLGALTVVFWGAILLVGFKLVVDDQASVRWLTAFSLSVLIPVLLVSDTSRETKVLWQVWPVVTIAVSLYVLVEFVVHANPLYDLMYEIVGRPVTQEWSVYRSHGSFGHPLYAATFFATSAAVALGRQVSQGSSALLWFAAALAGLLVTVSRGAILALVVAAVVVLVSAGASGARAGGLSKIVAALSAACVLVVASGVVQSRSESSEARSSLLARSDVVTGALDAARYSEWRGTGAGTSAHVFESLTSNEFEIESTPLQILVSLGLIGLVGFSMVIVGGILSAISDRNPAALGGLIAFGVAVSGYNAIESVLPLMAFLGVILVLAHGSREVTASNHTADSGYLRSQAG
jgi:hypothetical protein